MLAGWCWQITNRVTINYPLQQKRVVRVKPSIGLLELFQLAVAQKNLEPDRYELRHPSAPDVVLDLSTTLQHYALSEVTLAAKPFVPHGKFSNSNNNNRKCKVAYRAT